MSSASNAPANPLSAAATTTVTTATGITITPSAHHNQSIAYAQHAAPTEVLPTAPSATLTMTEIASLPPASLEEEILTLSLTARPSVRWDDDVVDNEGMGRKSSKRCCIFHKQRAFGESSTDSSDYDSDQSGSSAAASGDDEGETGQPKKAKKRNRKIAHKKKIPDSQRFHA